MADLTVLYPCFSAALTLQVNAKSLKIWNAESLEIFKIFGTRPVRLYSHDDLQSYLVFLRKITLCNVDVVEKPSAQRIDPFGTCTFLFFACLPHVLAPLLVKTEHQKSEY